MIFTEDQHVRDVVAVVGDSMAGLVSECRGWRDPCFQLRTKGMGNTAFLLIEGGDGSHHCCVARRV